ncbi:CAP domain-containing protein [Burkholderia cenocepacia]|uniref:CAP domain-containing protein n=1 Tax=Burkholderia cenocepacia TaxID=95486 RepID=UPI0021AB5D58|nr:CAP domain-containing protein [Burkholderia cenocepacia]
MMGLKQPISNFVLCAIAAAALSACGGGGDGGTSTSNPGTGGNPSTPTTPPSTGSALPPQTSVPAGTYAAQSANDAIFSAANAYRLSMGVGALRQDAILDVAAAAHAKYLQTNMLSGAIKAFVHDESSSLPGYTGAWPLQRARAAGAPNGQWVSEVVAGNFGAATAAANGAGCWSQWLNTVYHLVGVTGNTESVGVGVATPLDSSNPAYFCVLDLGTSTGVSRVPDPNDASSVNAIPAEGGQQFATNVVVHAPYSDESNVALAMSAEAPNPAPDLNAPGRPILVRVNAAQNNKLTVSSFQLVDSAGGAVAARIIVPSAVVAGSTATGIVADVNNALPNGVAVLLPVAPLKANTRYTVTFAGARDGAAVNQSWSFTTAAQ